MPDKSKLEAEDKIGTMLPVNVIGARDSKRSSLKLAEVKPYRHPCNQSKWNVWRRLQKSNYKIRKSVEKSLGISNLFNITEYIKILQNKYKKIKQKWENW